MKAERRAQRKNEKGEAGSGPPIDFNALVRYEPETANDETPTDTPNA